MSPVKTTLLSIFTRLMLHKETFKIYESASESEISSFSSCIVALDFTLEKAGVYRKETIGRVSARKNEV